MKAGRRWCCGSSVEGSNVNFEPDFTHHCLNINHDSPAAFFPSVQDGKGCNLIFAKTVAATFVAFFSILAGEHHIFFRVVGFVISELCTSLLCSLTLQLLFGLHCVCGSRSIVMWPLSKDQNPPFLCTWCQVQKKYSHSQTRSARPIVFAKFGSWWKIRRRWKNRKTIRATHFSLVFFLPFFLLFYSNSFIQKCVPYFC